MSTSLGLTVQLLATPADRVLVLGELAGALNGDGWFAPKDVADVFERLRVEQPGNLSREIGRLRSARFVTARAPRPSWSLTPLGHDRVKALVGGVDVAQVSAELVKASGAQLGHELHTLIPPTVAPVKWQPAIQRMLTDFEFDRNVFCMTRFPESGGDHDYLDPVAAVIPAAKSALGAHGLVLHLASDRQLDDDLFGNIAAHMWACKYGLALFEDRLNRGLNHNLVIEVGSMVITGRRCALLKDSTIERMPTDFVGHIYKPADFEDLQSVTTAVHHWAAQDLGLGPCRECPT